MIPPPPISTLFPYTTLFRSAFWFLRAERYEHEDGMPFRSVRRQCDELESTVPRKTAKRARSEEHTSELQSHHDLVCRLLLEKKKKKKKNIMKDETHMCTKRS